MSAPSRTKAEQALAAFTHALRPDWDIPGILAAIRTKPIAPLDQIAAATIKATTRRDQRTPHLIAEDDGTAFDMLLGRMNAEPTPTPPRTTTTCVDHGNPKPCRACAEHARTALRDPARIRAIREGRA